MPYASQKVSSERASHQISCLQLACLRAVSPSPFSLIPSPCSVPPLPQATVSLAAFEREFSSLFSLCLPDCSAHVHTRPTKIDLLAEEAFAQETTGTVVLSLAPHDAHAYTYLHTHTQTHTMGA